MAAAEESMPWVKFTRQETTVAQHLLLGASRCKIARVLKISEHTVKSHIQKIFKKPSIKSQKEFIAKYLSADKTASGVQDLSSNR